MASISTLKSRLTKFEKEMEEFRLKFKWGKEDGADFDKAVGNRIAEMEAEIAEAEEAKKR